MTKSDKSATTAGFAPVLRPMLIHRAKLRAGIVSCPNICIGRADPPNATGNIIRGPSYAPQYPCLLQYKLDGVRCVASCRLDDSGKMKIQLYGRSGKVFQNQPHLIRSLSILMAACDHHLQKYGTIYLDGELYVHGVATEHIIGSALRGSHRGTLGVTGERSSWQSEHKTEVSSPSMTNGSADNYKMPPLQLHLFDLFFGTESPHAGLPSKDRQKLLKDIIKTWRRRSDSAYRGHIQRVHSLTARSEQDVIRNLDQASSAGYEGVVLRDHTASYRVRGRSKHVLKLKHMKRAHVVLLRARTSARRSHLKLTLQMGSQRDSCMRNCKFSMTVHKSRLFSEAAQVCPCIALELAKGHHTPAIVVNTPSKYLVSIAYSHLSSRGVPQRAQFECIHNKAKQETDT